MAVLRVASINARGLGSPWKQGHLLNDLRSLDIDVVAISETRISETHSFAPVFDDFEVYASLSRPRSGGGVAVLFRKGLDLKIRTIFLDPDGKSVVLDVSNSEGGAFRLVAVYAPTGAGRPDFFRRLEPFLGTSRSLVLVGDWNGILDARWDCVGLADRSGGCKSLKNLLRRFQLSDRYRLDFPNAPVWTWSNRTGESRSYLDRVFIRLADKDSVGCPLFKFVDYTDHKFVICTVDLDKTHRQGPGYWKLNASFPARKAYGDRISDLVRRRLTGAIVNNRWWGALKRAIRVESIGFSKEVAKEKNRAEGELVSKLEEAISKGIATDVLAARLALDHFFNAKHEGCVVRAKARALRDEGTKAVRWARVAEARRGNKATIRSLTDRDGRVVSDSKQMCAAFQRHFAELFGADGGPETVVDYSSYLDGLPRLSAVDAESCEKPITAAEIRSAVSECARGKSPGLDGLPYELYANMPDLFGDLLADVYCNWQQNGRIPRSVSRGVVALLRKDPNKGDVIDNFRPITLLNADFKILAKVLATRLALVVGSVVGKAQTCSIPKRSIHDNLHLMRYIIERVGNKPGFGGALINLDQSKAFDRVDHRYLAAVLKAAGFGPVFRGWIASMYSGICSVVRVNGHLSEPFEITRSVRQGCPLSSLLYVLTLEPLLRKLEMLRGIPLELGRGRAVSAYADDVTVMVSDTTEVEVVGTVLKEYEAVTGAKLNPDKSVGLQLGTWRGKLMPSDSVVGRWTDGPVKLLGVWFGPDLQEDRNWDEVTSRVASLTQKWAERKLSLKGRAEVANTYIASVIYYRLTVVPCSSLRLTKLERLLFRFLWKGRVPLVRRSICCQHPLNGGLGMPWLMMRRHALRLRHLHRFLHGEQVWSPFVRHVFPLLVSLTELQTWVKRRPRLGAWHLECCQALTALYQSGNADGGSSTLAFYRGLVVGKSDDVLGETLGVDENQLASLFRRTFGPGTMDNFQKSLAWQCYRGALPVRDKLYRHGSAASRTCPRCAQSDETVLHALFQCPSIGDLWVFVEQLLSRVGRIRLTAESIVKIAPPPSFSREGQAVFLCLVAMAKEVVWWTRLKGLKTDTFLFGQILIDFFKFHLERKVRVEREVLPPNKFVERWVRVARMARVNGPTLSMRL